MKGMVLKAARQPLQLEELPDRDPGPGEIRVRVEACGVCRTDLHVVDGVLPDPKLPIIPGHEIVGIVDALGTGVTEPELGARVGVPWLGRTCGVCVYCTSGRENLCDNPLFTGYTRDGGFATQAVADAAFAFPLSGFDDPVAAAPLMCAGLVGWRSLGIAGKGRRIGLYGFGAAAHILAQVCRWQGREVYAFTRQGDEAAQGLARDLGASWAGSSAEPPPVQLDAAIIFAPVGTLVPTALRAVRKGGRVVCGGIYMSDIPRFPYSILWEERQLVSVANLTRQDAREFLAIASKAAVQTTTTAYPLAKANEALSDLRAGRLRGAAVLVAAQAGVSAAGRMAPRIASVKASPRRGFSTIGVSSAAARWRSAAVGWLVMRIAGRRKSLRRRAAKRSRPFISGSLKSITRQPD